MDKKYLFEGESLISESADNVVTLTSHRIRYESSDSKTSHIVSIMLEKISSIEIHYKSWIIVLYIGVASALGGLAMGADNRTDGMGAGFLIAGICILLYFVTRKHVVTISSDGGAKIHFETKGLKRDNLLDFINKVEQAKANRLK